MNATALSRLSLGRKLKLAQLMVFESVLETGSFIRAANALGLTQPAVTKTISELESVLGGAVFERSNRGVRPTEFGKMIATRVKSLIAEMRYMTDEINAFRTGEAGHVIIGTLIAGSAKLLPRAVVQLRKSVPGVTVTIREGTTTHLFPALATGDIDIVVGRIPREEFDSVNSVPLTHEPLFCERYCAVVGHQSRLASANTLTMGDLTTEDWIFPLLESPAYSVAENLFRSAGVPVPKRHTFSLSILSNIGMLLESDMIALMPRAAARQFVGDGLLRILPLPQEAEFGEVGYSIRTDREPSPSCRNFIASLREVAQDLAEVANNNPI